jgi:ribonucleotide monophosphatase NagD (HAD superfamily)
VTDNPQPTTIGALLARYAGILLDAYGVLVDASGARPGAEDLIAELAGRRFPYAIVTNDASRSQATQARRFAGLGMPVPPDRFVTSGSLLPGYYARASLTAARTLVLGTQDSIGFVVEGGGVPVPLEPGAELDALAVCDDAGFPFLDGIEIAQSAVIRAVEAGRRPALILPNPDLVYPKGNGELGLTAGSIALVIEAVLARRFGGDAPRFVHLGKPEPHLFIEASRRLAVPADRLVMIGDQLETDIAGAHAAGVDAALLEGGVSAWDRTREQVATPRYRLASLAL